MSKRSHRQYSEEFKRNALELVETSGKSVNQIEQDLGLSAGLLHKWRERYQVEDAAAGMEKSESNSFAPRCGGCNGKIKCWRRS